MVQIMMYKYLVPRTIYYKLKYIDQIVCKFVKRDKDARKEKHD